MQPDKKFNGREVYTFHVIIKASNSVLDRIEFVTYRLPAWPKRSAVRTVTEDERNTLFFEFKELAWGGSTVYADVKIKGQDEIIRLSHPIILTETGE